MYIATVTNILIHAADVRGANVNDRFDKDKFLQAAFSKKQKMYLRKKYQVDYFENYYE